MITRRKLCLGSGFGLLAMAVQGCTTVTDSNGNKTLVLNVVSFYNVLNPLTQAVQLAFQSPLFEAKLSPTALATVQADVAKVQQVAATVKAKVGETVTLTLANPWYLTVEQAINDLATIATAVEPQLPSNITTMINAAVSLVYPLEAVINVAAGLASGASNQRRVGFDGRTALTEQAAKAIVSAGL